MSAHPARTAPGAQARSGAAEYGRSPARSSRLRRRSRRTPYAPQRAWRLLPRLIFLSGTTDSAEYMRFLEGTGALVLCKPFDIDTLQRLVRQFLLDQDTPRIGQGASEEAEYLPL